VSLIHRVLELRYSGTFRRAQLVSAGDYTRLALKGLGSICFFPLGHGQRWRERGRGKCARVCLRAFADAAVWVGVGVEARMGEWLHTTHGVCYGREEDGGSGI
jgi:hypothetical protein